MLSRRELAIGDSNAAQVTEALAIIGAELMVETLASGDFTGEPQPDEGVTYAAKISKDEARIDWSRPAVEVARHVQGLAPFPGAWFDHDDARIKLLAASCIDGSGAPGQILDDSLAIACGTGAIRPRLLQRAGKSPMRLDDFLRGHAIAAGTLLP